MNVSFRVEVKQNLNFAKKHTLATFLFARRLGAFFATMEDEDKEKKKRKKSSKKKESKEVKDKDDSSTPKKRKKTKASAIPPSLSVPVDLHKV